MPTAVKIISMLPLSLLLRRQSWLWGVIILSLSVVGAGIGAAQGIKDVVTNFELDNGLQVVVIEDHRVPVVQHMIWYRVGAADEPVGSSGVAHFLEHLMFKGTETMAVGEFSSLVAANGGRDNAFTSWDYTAYFQRIATDRLGLVMRLEADRMTNLRLTENDIVTERKVILEERNERIETNPSGLFREQLDASQYLNHGYGIPVIGWMHEIEGLEEEDILAFYRDHYAPNNAVLVVAGDVDPEQVRRLAAEHYGKIPSNPRLLKRKRTQEPPQRAERRLIYRDVRVEQPYVSRSYLAPERDPGAQEGAAALSLLAQLLGGGKTSFLAEKLQFDRNVAVYVAAFYSGMRLDDTTFDLIVVPAAGVSLKEAETALDDALTQFIQTGIDPSDLARIKRQIRASEIYARDSAAGIARRYGAALTSGLTVEDVQSWLEILQATTEQQIMAAATSVLRKETSVTGWLMGQAESTQ
ncbi:MAG: pitrilysin family protein [Aestuariivita sp.]|nr:pitrilysin family protein [Aestuariivita sp.]MCY4347514.1 pitrilysin family protein [Aestuariivita sp.]